MRLLPQTRLSIIALTLLMTCCAALYAQTGSGEFLGAPWGSDRAATARAMLKRDGVTTGTTPDLYRGGKVAGYAVDYALTSFNANGALYCGVIFFTEIEAADFARQWFALKNQLAEKYGPVQDESPAADEARRAKWTTSNDVTVLLYINEEDYSIRILYLHYPLSKIRTRTTGSSPATDGDL